MPAPRTTLSLLPPLAAIAQQPIPSGRSLSERLATMAQRYAALVSTPPTNLASDQLLAAVNLAATLDLTHPAAQTSLLGLLKLNRDSKLGYIAETLTTAQLYSIIHLAERLMAHHGPGPYSADQLAAASAAA